ncbi:MAG: T9SS type A sorting domain-containing protein [Breznakibacter sp.]|nr:T9SS type A sorting domain-containing protein [Breznakibacter sp.]
MIIWEISGDDLANGAPMSTIAYNKLLANRTTTQLSETNSDEFTVFPNPATNFVMFQINEMPELARVAFYDLSGSVVLEQKLDNSPIELNLPKGVYLYKISYANKTQTGKILIK